MGQAQRTSVWSSEPGEEAVLSDAGSPRHPIPADWCIDPLERGIDNRAQVLEEQANALLAAAQAPEQVNEPVTLIGEDDVATELEWVGLPFDVIGADEGELAWQAEALCAQTDPEAFFPEKGGSTREAKKVCGSCTVRSQCLEYALANDERFGIWGGLSERERRKLRKRAV